MVRIERDAKDQVGSLGKRNAERISKFMHDRLATPEDPRRLGGPLKGSTLGGTSSP